MENIVVGLDVHKINTQICKMSSEGQILEETRIQTSSARFADFFGNSAKMTIGLEMSGGIFAVAQWLFDLGHDVRLLKPSTAKAFRRHGKKTDREDARCLAKALQSGVSEEVLYQPQEVREMKALLSNRQHMIKQRVQLTNHLRSILREFGYTFPKGKKAFLEQVPREIEKVELQALRESLQKSFEKIKELFAEEKEIDTVLFQLYGKSEKTQKLMSIPGIGIQTALCLQVSVYDSTRFRSAKQVSAYLGLTPREYSSGQKRRLGPITKAGCGLTRMNLIHGARVIYYMSKGQCRLVNWSKKVSSHKNAQIVALASKLARIAYGVLKYDTPYNPAYQRRPLMRAAA